jgi:excisionase family DNA binding protein
MPFPSPKPITPHPEAPGAPLMDIPAVARRLDISDKTVRRFIDRGELHAFRIGRLLRISEEEYLRFLAARV